jgi:hypothetical protein
LEIRHALCGFLALPEHDGADAPEDGKGGDGEGDCAPFFELVAAVLDGAHGFEAVFFLAHEDEAGFAPVCGSQGRRDRRRVYDFSAQFLEAEGCADFLASDALSAADEAVVFVLAVPEVEGVVYGALDGAFAHAVDVFLDDVFGAELAHEAVDGGNY